MGWRIAALWALGAWATAAASDVEHGADLAAFRAIDLSGPGAAAALREFVLAWPESGLAERAWERLVWLDATPRPAELDRTARRHLARLDRSWAARVAARQAVPRAVAPAPIDPNAPEPPPPEPALTLSSAATALREGAWTGGAMDVGVGWGPVSAHLRVGAAARATVELVARGSWRLPPAVAAATSVRAAFAEAGAAPDGSVRVGAGLGLRVAPGVEVEAGGGAVVAKRIVEPRAAVGLRWRLPLRAP